MSAFGDYKGLRQKQAIYESDINLKLFGCGAVSVINKYFKPSGWNRT